MDATQFRGRRQVKASSRTAVARTVSPPETAACKHQLYRFLDRGLWPVCARCAAREDCPDKTEGGVCGPAQAAQESIFRQVMELPHVRPEDAGLVAEYAKLTVACEIVDLHVARAGLVLSSEGEPVAAQPILGERLRLSAALRALAGDLGLSPAARSRLRQDPDRGPGAEMARLVRAAREAEEAERREVVDGDFSAEEDDGNGD